MQGYDWLKFRQMPLESPEAEKIRFTLAVVVFFMTELMVRRRQYRRHHLQARLECTMGPARRPVGVSPESPRTLHVGPIVLRVGRRVKVPMARNPDESHPEQGEDAQQHDHQSRQIGRLHVAHRASCAQHGLYQGAAPVCR